MFQNINEDTINENNNIERKEKLNIFSNVFSVKNIGVYLVSFMLSLVGVGGEFSVFSISALGASFASSIPALGVIVVSLIGNLVKFGINGALEYFITVLVLTISMILIKPRYNEKERNEKIKIGKNIFISTFLIQFVKLMISGFMVYDILVSITFSIIALVFYKVFVNSMIVLQDITNRQAFSIEEVIGASVVLSIAVTAFGDFSILGFSVKNVLSILIVMILGWKNGILVGTTSGVTIGITLGVITGSEPIMIAAYAISRNACRNF